MSATEHPGGFCLHCRGGDRFDQFSCVTMPSGTSARFKVALLGVDSDVVVDGCGPDDVPYDGSSPNERAFDERHGL